MGLKHNLHFDDRDGPIKGFQEVIFSVSDLERWTDFFERICDWSVLSRGQASDAQKEHWNLEVSTKITEVLLHKSGTNEGYVRLVHFEGVEQQQIRSACNVWDTGGIFDVNIRVEDMETFYKELQLAGWNGITDPVRYTFSEYDVSEVLMKGPDGIVIAFMQRFAPPLVGFDELQKTSRVFNSSVIVRDIKASHDFFVNTLGFSIFFQTEGTGRSAGENVLGIPLNINKDISVPIHIVRPDKDQNGSIEYLCTKELKGKDCAAIARPPHLGVLMYRFPVRDAYAYAKKLQNKHLTLHTAIQTVDILGYGNCKVFSVLSPDGAWLEFIELID